MGEPDQAYFREWDARAPGERRCLARARALLHAAGLDSPGPPVLTVVGSKGKGTAAVYASAYLCAAGQRVVTLTSPSLGPTTERIRVDGVPVDNATLAGLGAKLEALRPARTAGTGYLSPSGMFLLAALAHARDVGADTVVLEAGRGGRSDEVSLVSPAVVAVAPVFAEHLDQLGGSVAAVVADKLGVVRAGTRAVVVGTQAPATWHQIHHRLVTGTGLRPIDAATDPAGDIPAHLLPPGLGAANARLGCVAAYHLLGAAPEAAALRRVLGSVHLPGRLSWHHLPGTGTDLVVDAAVDRTGVAAAIQYARTRLGGIDHVLLSLPDGKDLAGAADRLRGLPVTFVTLPTGHLSYRRPVPPEWATVPVSEVDRGFVAARGARVLALGTVSFVSHMLRLAAATTAVAFRR